MYVNKQTRKQLALLGHIHGVMSQVESEFDERNSIKFDLKYLRMSKTFLFKFMEEKVYQELGNKELKTLKNFMDTTNLLMDNEYRLRERVKSWEKTKSNEIVEVSRNYIEDLIVLATNEHCLGCQGKENCELLKMLERFDVPATSNYPKYCKYELKERHHKK